MMINALFKGSYEELSCVKLSIFQVCLEEQDGVDIYVHLQDIIVMNKEEMIQVQVQVMHSVTCRIIQWYWIGLSDGIFSLEK